MQVVRTSNQGLRVFFLLTFLLATPDILYRALNQQWLDAVLAYCMCTALLACPLYLFHRWLRGYLWLLLPLGILSVISLGCVLVYNINLNFDVLLVIRNTTFGEATELLKGYLLLIIGGVVFYFGLYYLLVRRAPYRIRGKSAAIASGSGVLFLLITPLVKKNQGSFVDQAKINIADFYPGSIYYATNLMVQQHDIVSKYGENTKNFTFHARPKPAPAERQVYVMIIGETGRYDHWGINGYPRPTSPKLAQRQSQLFSFGNVASGAYLTEYSVPMLLTRATATNYDLHYHEKSVVSLFKESGFKTYWVSNQFDYGNIGIHANEADARISFSSAYQATKGVHFDMELVGALQRVLAKKEPRVFIVLHTLGSHYDYDARYPANYAVFRPTARDLNATPTDYANRQALVNSYDNSIRYTDAVIDSTITLLDREKALTWVSYTADHGEELFDDSRKMSQHGFPVPSIYVAHTPWFVWMSSGYKSTFPARARNLEKNKDLPIGSQNVFYTLADLGNIQFAGQDSTKSVAGALTPQPQLMLGGDSKVYNVKNFAKPAAALASQQAAGAKSD